MPVKKPIMPMCSRVKNSTTYRARFWKKRFLSPLSRFCAKSSILLVLVAIKREATFVRRLHKIYLMENDKNFRKLCSCAKDGGSIVGLEPRCLELILAFGSSNHF